MLLAGKGHEDYQVIGTTKQHFDDREEAQRALQLRPDAQPRSGQLTPQAMLGAHPSIELPLERVLGATGGRLIRGTTHRFAAVTIDSRAVIPGSLFVAIRGERLDGQDVYKRQHIDIVVARNGRHPKRSEWQRVKCLAGSSKLTGQREIGQVSGHHDMIERLLAQIGAQRIEQLRRMSSATLA